MTHAQAVAIEGVAGNRLASALATVTGVERALVATLEGELVAAEPAVDGTEAGREAALATFVAKRAEALSTDGDLRGMGRLLAAFLLSLKVLSSGLPARPSRSPEIAEHRMASSSRSVSAGALNAGFSVSFLVPLIGWPRGTFFRSIGTWP